MVRTVLERRGKEDDEKVKIAILDSGIDPALKAAVDENMATKDWTASPHRADDLLGHGTYAAGIIGQLAPKAQLFIEKVFESFEGDAQTTNRIARVSAFRLSHSGAAIITASAGNSSRSNSLEREHYFHVIRLS